MCEHNPHVLLAEAFEPQQTRNPTLVAQNLCGDQQGSFKLYSKTASTFSSEQQTEGCACLNRKDSDCGLFPTEYPYRSHMWESSCCSFLFLPLALHDLPLKPLNVHFFEVGEGIFTKFAITVASNSAIRQTLLFLFRAVVRQAGRGPWAFGKCWTLVGKVS